jgi:Predicted CoA-binding protein
MKAQELMKFKNWAVVGDITNSEKYAYKIKKSLIEADFNVYGVNPRAKEAEVLKGLKYITNEIEVVDLCINPKTGIEVVKEAKDLGIKYILIQPGAESTEILDYCKNNGIEAIEGCALVELSKMN